MDNAEYRRALQRIDISLPRYICDDRDDEASHASLINAFLEYLGQEAINLDAFRTLRGPAVPGLERVGRLTNLTNLNVDTSWYLRYRGAGNPDFGDAFPQLVDIQGQTTIPTRRWHHPRELQVIAQSAAFHFAAIEQGGSSLYVSLIPKATNLNVLRILASIGPTEVYHFATFQNSLEGIAGTRFGTVRFPDLRSNRELAEAVMPEPCTFLSPDFPPCSVIRPGSTENAGAVAAATGLVQSGLFAGQSNDFLAAVGALAAEADAAFRA